LVLGHLSQAGESYLATTVPVAAVATAALPEIQSSVSHHLEEAELGWQIGWQNTERNRWILEREEK